MLIDATPNPRPARLGRVMVPTLSGPRKTLRLDVATAPQQVRDVLRDVLVEEELHASFSFIFSATKASISTR